MSKIDPQPSLKLDLPIAAIVDFARRWKIVKIEVFGSVLRDDFDASSDVDFLVTFERGARWSLFDLVDAESELSQIIGRRVDLVERPPIEKSANWLKRRNILGGARTVYAA